MFPDFYRVTYYDVYGIRRSFEMTAPDVSYANLYGMTLGQVVSVALVEDWGEEV
jgi:hypothetical protein